MGGMHMNRSLWRKAVALTLTAAMTAGLTACGGGGNSTSADGKKRYFKADYLSDLPDSFNDTTSNIQFKGDVMYYTSSNEDYTKSGLYSYNLITGEDVSGGKWQKETHDYHSLPLMIRPNTVLALGNNDQKPDYDYADGVSLLVSAFDEEAEAKTEIPDLKGETVMTVTAKRVGDEIHLHVEGGNGNYTVRSLSGCKVVVEA
mgnify:CR=1 FL=1